MPPSEDLPLGIFELGLEPRDVPLQLLLCEGDVVVEDAGGVRERRFQRLPVLGGHVEP